MTESYSFSVTFVTFLAQLDIYGRVRTFEGSDISDCPFRYQGQYQDTETGLYYNRFRYYDPEAGSYISKDPIGLAGGNPTLYGYVKDTNGWVDVFGLAINGVSGGSHRNTDKLRGVTEANHMPSSAASRKGVSGISHGKGPTTSMDIGDHYQTASWGNRTTSKQWQEVQEDLIRRGKFGKAMEMDIRDIKCKFGNKYDDGMRSMIDYAVEENYISRKEGERLKRKHLHSH